MLQRVFFLVVLPESPGYVMSKCGTKSIGRKTHLSSGFSLVRIKSNTTLKWYSHCLFIMFMQGRQERQAFIESIRIPNMRRFLLVLHDMRL